MIIIKLLYNVLSYYLLIYRLFTISIYDDYDDYHYDDDDYDVVVV